MHKDGVGNDRNSIEVIIITRPASSAYRHDK